MVRTLKNRIIKLSVRTWKLSLFMSEFLHLRYRLMRRLRFRYAKLITCAMFRLWVKEIHNEDRLPQKGPVIIVSNHTSYYDWIVLSAIYDKKYIVFIGNQDLLRRPFVNWLVRLNILIYIDPKNPGFSYFREVLNRLKHGHVVVIYPEGTRSKSGRMIEPKIGFVKLALTMNVPIIPLAMKGAYDILPPHKKMPRLKQCELFVGDPFFINRDNPMFRDIFQSEENSGKRLSDAGMKEVAFRIMDKIADMAGQEWDSSVAIEEENFLGKPRRVFFEHQETA